MKSLPTWGELYGLMTSTAVPIKNGSELILYGGHISAVAKDEIWKYNVEANTWTKYI